MQVTSLEITVYEFTVKEMNYLMDIGIWYFITSRLRDNEKIEIVNE